MKKKLSTRSAVSASLANEVIDEFDFEEVHKMMRAVGWKWAVDTTSDDGIPTIGDLRRNARRLFESLKFRGNDRGACLGTGGLFVTAHRDRNDRTTYAELQFRGAWQAAESGSES